MTPMFLKVEIYEFINKFKNKHLELKINLLNIIDLCIGQARLACISAYFFR